VGEAGGEAVQALADGEEEVVEVRVAFEVGQVLEGVVFEVVGVRVAVVDSEEVAEEGSVGQGTHGVVLGDADEDKVDRQSRVGGVTARGGKYETNQGMLYTLTFTYDAYLDACLEVWFQQNRAGELDVNVPIATHLEHGLVVRFESARPNPAQQAVKLCAANLMARLLPSSF